MSTFNEIVAEAQRTAHKTYSLEIVVPVVTKHNKIRMATKVIKAPAPKVKRSSSSPSDELAKVRDTERRQRALDIASIVHRTNETACEKLNVSLAELIDPPVHVSIADDSLAIFCDKL